MNAFVEKIVCSNLGDKQRNTNDCSVSVTWDEVGAIGATQRPNPVDCHGAKG